ncbi:MAG: rod shape-determining protein MreD [Syntrophomonadaceae bacterium]|nr:rod shape-determining protein MreD [Syntrophomonadaceae bacterium]MDD3022965.1 rod shape-determining protein MreD [Syntrophomonadaceae bacterium]
MRYFLLLILPVLAIFFQSTLFNSYSIKGTIPDIVLIFVVFYSLLNNSSKGAAYGFLCGLLEDLYMGRFIGINALSKALTAYAIGRLQGNVFKENILVGVIAVLMGTVINSLLLVGISLAVSDIYNIDAGLFISIFLQCVYNSIIAVPAYIWYYNSSHNGWLRNTGENLNESRQF